MANRISVSVTEDSTSPEWLKNVEPYIEKLLFKLSLNQAELSVLFCSDSFIQDLNSQYRGIDRPTDVLSFENGDEYTDEEGTWSVLGDIAISLETLPKNATYFEETLDTELKRLILHGILHLTGMDHGEEHIEKGVLPTCQMLVKQEQILSEFSDFHIINGEQP